MQEQFVSSNANSNDKQFVGLEIGRFFCALSILFWHYPHFFFYGAWSADTFSPSDKEVLPLYKLFGFLYRNGHYAVPVFWMFSGFIFTWKYADSIRHSIVTARQFFILRFSRLYPLHIATLLIVTSLQFFYMKSHGAAFIYPNNDAPRFLENIFFVSGLLNAIPPSFNGPSWSVSVEIFVYAIFFILAQHRQMSAATCILIASAAKVLSYAIDENILQCLEYFYIGGSMQFLSHYLPKRHEKLAFSIAAAALAVSLTSEFKIGSIVGFSVSMLAFFYLLGKIAPSALHRLGKLGDLTYASYLIHFPIQIGMVLIIDFLGVSREFFLSPVALSLFVLVTLGFSWGFFQAYEIPAQSAIRKRFLGRKESLAVP